MDGAEAKFNTICAMLRAAQQMICAELVARSKFYHEIIRNDRDGNGGGVAIYIKENIAFNRILNFMSLLLTFVSTKNLSLQFSRQKGLHSFP